MSTTTTSGDLFADGTLYAASFQAGVTLVCVLCLADQATHSSDDPAGHVVGQLQATYPQPTITQLHAAGLAILAAGRTIPHLHGGTITLDQAYRAIGLIPDAWIPSDQAPPSKVVYKPISLTITYAPAAEEIEPVDQPWRPNQEPLPSPEYPDDKRETWKNPDFSNDLTWLTVYREQWDFTLECWKYSVAPTMSCLLTANPGYVGNTQEYMTLPYFDCFRQARESDGSGYWHEGKNPWWISRGINDSWKDSADELRRRYDGTWEMPLQAIRAKIWLGTSGVESRWYYYQYLDYHDLQVRARYQAGQPVTIAEPQSAPPGIIPILAGLSIPMCLLLFGIGSISLTSSSSSSRRRRKG